MFDFLSGLDRRLDQAVARNIETIEICTRQNTDICQFQTVDYTYPETPILRLFPSEHGHTRITDKCQFQLRKNRESKREARIDESALFWCDWTSSGGRHTHELQ